MRRVVHSSFIVVLLICVSTSAVAQTSQTGVLAGTVTDQTGAVLPGVTVEAKHQERGIVRSATTDTSGRFRMGAMALGAYTLTASLSGFENAVVKGSVVELGRTTDVNVTLRLAAASEAIVVTGDAPVVDRTNVTVTQRVRVDEFEKLPVRSYHTLVGMAPGIPGTGGGNVNAHGALSSNNQFLFDGVDTTDTTTGTFGSNLNFESVQEVTISTAGISAEYGRAVGAIVNVITKSGGNTFAGSAKWIGTNDEWNAQNKTKNELTGASLAREKLDKVSPTNSFTLGGPFWRDRIWFFGAWEKAKSTSAQFQTPITGENYRQTLESPFWDYRITAQMTPSHGLWFRQHDSPTTGFVVSYGRPAETFALTRQDQTGNSLAGQWTGVFGQSVSAEIFAATQTLTINVFPFRTSSLTGGATHFSQADGYYYNGAFFDGFVDRPRKQLVGAVSIFRSMFGRAHDVKIGFDRQDLESQALFTFQNNQLFIDRSFDPATRTFVPNTRRDYDPPAASVSKGEITALYIRDKVDIVDRLFMEAGVRFEKQTSESDLGVTTVDTSTWSPRLSFSYDLRGDGKSLIVGSYARPYQFITQSFSDSFAQIPQKGNYTNYTWDGTKYVQGNRIVVGGSTNRPNPKVNPSYVDELTFGFQRQLGAVMGVGIRGVWRSWGDLIDDIEGFNPDGTRFFRVENYDRAEREYRGVELTFERRFSKNWSANVNYTWSRTTGNHFDNAFSQLGDFVGETCRSTVDLTIGNKGVISCREVQEGANRNGRAGYDRPHNLKAQAAYVFHLGPVNLTTGMTGEYISGATFVPNQSMDILLPGTTTRSGLTATYWYEKLGEHRLPSTYYVDSSIEATYRIWKSVEFGAKGEIFNAFNRQDKLGVTFTAYCADAASTNTTCKTQRERFGKATARGNFRGPRGFRLTALLRF